MHRRHTSFAVSPLRPLSQHVINTLALASLASLSLLPLLLPQPSLLSLPSPLPPLPLPPLPLPPLPLPLLHCRCSSKSA